jgi:hypothetical protein
MNTIELNTKTQQELEELLFQEQRVERHDFNITLMLALLLGVVSLLFIGVTCIVYYTPPGGIRSWWYALAYILPFGIGSIVMFRKYYKQKPAMKIRYEQAQNHIQMIRAEIEHRHDLYLQRQSLYPAYDVTQYAPHMQ